MMRQGFQNKRESGKRGLIFPIFWVEMPLHRENIQCTFPSKKYMSILSGSTLASETPLASKRYKSILGKRS